MAIVAGSALNFAPNTFQTLADMGFLSSDGRCRSFDADGSGYARGEGVCVVVLKRLGDVDADDRIRAVVRATGVNQDGKTGGITVPSSESQQALISETYAAAGLDPDGTGFFEAHGTGTSVGDPLEARAVGAVFGTSSRTQKLYMGSVKSNIGHLEGAAGLAGIMKATLSIENGTILPNMHFEKPNPDILFDKWKLEVPTSAVEWPTTVDQPRRASINSFGYGGTNAHAILEQYISKQPSASKIQAKINGTALLGGSYDMSATTRTITQGGRPYLLALTSHSKEAGTLTAEALLDYVGRNPNTSVGDLAYSLCHRRTLHRFRSFVIGSDTSSVESGLFVSRTPDSWEMSTADGALRLGFVFTGQGAQYFDMGRQLIEQCPIFRDSLDRCDAALQHLPDKPKWSIVDELMRPEPESRLLLSKYSQPVCTALQVAIVDLLLEWGVKPRAVCAHSSGEIGAAYIAGILTLETAMAVAYYRGLHMSEGDLAGSMISVGLSKSAAESEVAEYRGLVVIAAVNSPSNVTLSGDAEAVKQLQRRLAERGVFSRFLKVEQAYHSHHMLPLAPGYIDSLEKYNSCFPQAPSAKCRMFSSVTARAAEASRMGPLYWADNMVKPVRFYDALIGTVLDENDALAVDVVVEIGPHPALKAPSKETLGALKIDLPYLGTLQRGKPAFESLLECVGHLFKLGYPVDLEAVNRDTWITRGGKTHHEHGKRLLDMPSYSWNHKPYWSVTRLSNEHLQRPSRHSLLGAPVPGSIRSMPRWRNYIRLPEIPWLRDHCVDGLVIFPAAGFCCMAIEAAVCAGGKTARRIAAFRLRDVMIKAPMALNEDDEGVETSLELRPVTESSRTTSDEWSDFTVFSYDKAGGETEHCRGIISVEYGDPAGLSPLDKVPHVDTLLEKSDRRTSAAALYSRLESINLHYGEYFALLKEDIMSGRGFATTSFTFNPGVFSAHELAEKTILHPTLLDSTFHVIFSAVETLLGRHISDAFVSTYMARLDVSGILVEQAGKRDLRQYVVQTHTELPNQRTAVNHILLHENGRVVVEAQGNEITAIGTEGSKRAGRSLFFRQRWRPSFDHLELETSPLNSYELVDLVCLYVHQSPASRVLVVPSDPDCAQQVAGQLSIPGTGRPLCEALHVMPDPKWTRDEVCGLESDLGTLGRVCNPEGVYDLIVLDTNSALARDFQIVRFAAQSGALVTNAILTTSHDWKVCFPPSPAWAVYRPERAAYSWGHITVVHSSIFSDSVRDILRELWLVCPDGVVSTTTLVEVAREELQSTSVVVLASLDEPLNSPEALSGARAILTAEGKRVVWVTKNATVEASHPEQAQILGLLRTARNENRDSRYISLDVEHSSPATRVARRVMQVLNPESSEEDFTERLGCLYVPRIDEDLALNRRLPNGIGNAPRRERFGDHSRISLRIGKVGLLDTLHFVEDEDGAPLGAEEAEVQIKASALNFHDVAVAMGMIEDHNLGNECSGVVTRVGENVDRRDLQVGDRVIAWRPGQGSHGTSVRQPAALCIKMPESMSFAVAASISIVLTTAYYALYEVARLQPGETLLIHSAAGGVGQIAIQLARRVGATVFVTCSEPKRELLRSRYGIEDSNIFSSRDDSFVRRIQEATSGKGVDVVFNCLAGKLLHASWTCIKPFGRFIEIGKRDIHQNTKLAMEPFRNNVSFTSIDLILIYELKPEYAGKLLRDSFALFFNGAVAAPVGLHEFPYSQVDKAFRLMQLGKHTGKIVLVTDQEDMVAVGPKVYRHRQLFLPDKTYLLVGGLGGLGTATAEWMYGCGARSFVFLSRAADERPGSKRTVDWLRSRNARVSIYKGDVAELADVKRVVADVGPSLAGVFHLAVQLQDSMIGSLTLDQMQAVVRTKVAGAWNIHEATLSSNLDFFVCWSSVSAICGNKGQGAYVAASAHMDALMRWRREQGLVGTAMNLGAVPTRGLVAENTQIRQSLERNKLDTLSEQELMFLVEEAVTLDRPEHETEGLDWHQLIVGINVDQPDVWWAERSVFRSLYANRTYDGAPCGRQAQKNLVGLLAAAASAEAATEICLEAFVEKVAAVLGSPASSILPANSLFSYGLDSIVAVELRGWFKEIVNVNLSLFDIIGAASILSLVEKVVSLLPSPIESRDGDEVRDERSNGTHELNGGGGKNTVRDCVIDRIPKARVEESVPMSVYQEWMYRHHVVPSPTERWRLNLTNTFKVCGKPNSDILLTALGELVQRQSVLSSAYLDTGCGLVQKPLGKSKLKLVDCDISGSPNAEERVRGLVESSRRQNLSIEDGEVASVTFVVTSDVESLIILTVHHICFDRASLTIFMRSWMNLYEAIASGQSVDTVPLPARSYVDFTMWHNERLLSEEMAPHREFWKQKLRDVPETSGLLPSAKQDMSPVLGLDRGLTEVQLDSQAFTRLKRISTQLGVTPFHFFLAAIRGFLFRCNSEEDLVILMVDGSRPRAELEELVGPCVNLVPLRFREDFSGMTFDELVTRASSEALEALSHTAIPFEEIFKLVRRETRPGIMPVGQLAVNYQMYGSPAKYRTTDFEICTRELINIPTFCELSFEIAEEQGSGIRFFIEYSMELYEAQDIDCFSQSFLIFLKSAIKDYMQPIQEIPT